MTLLASLPSDIFDLIIDRLDVYSIRSFNLASRACHALVAVKFWECLALFAESPSVFDTIGYSMEYHEPAEFRSWSPRFCICIRYASQLQQLAQSLRRDSRALSHVRMLRLRSRDKVSKTSTLKSIFKAGAIDSNNLYTSVLKLLSEKCVALEVLDIQTRAEGFITEVVNIFPRAPAVQLQCWSAACLGQLHSYKNVRAVSIRVRKDESLKPAISPSDNLSSIHTLVLIVEDYTKVQSWQVQHYLGYMHNVRNFHLSGQLGFAHMDWLSPKIVNLSLNGTPYTHGSEFKNTNIKRLEVGRIDILQKAELPRLTTLNIDINTLHNIWYPNSIEDAANSLAKSPYIVNLSTNKLQIGHIVTLLERCNWSLRRLVISNPVGYSDPLGADLLTPLADALVMFSPELESLCIDHVDTILDRGYTSGNDRDAIPRKSIAALRLLVKGLPRLQFIYFMYKPTSKLSDFFYAKVQTGPAWNDTVFLFDHVDDHMHQIRHIVKSPFSTNNLTASYKVVNFDFFSAKEWTGPFASSGPEQLEVVNPPV